MRKNEKEQKRTMQGKSIMMGISTLALLISNSMVAFASSGNYGQNGANWMLDQIFWVALVAFIVGAVVMAAKKNTIGVVTTIIVGKRLWVLYCNKGALHGRRKETECDGVLLS